MSPLGHGAAHNPKGVHYVANLGAALVRGAWSDANPGATPNGSPLSWDELIRKWGKHTGGNTQLIHALRSIADDDLVAAHHLPRRAVNAPNGSVVPNGSRDASTPSPTASRLNDGRPEHSREGNAAAAALPNGSASSDRYDKDGADGASPEAWAEGDNWARPPLEPKFAEDVKEAGHVVEILMSGSTLSTSEQLSAALIMAYSLYALGNYDAAVAAYQRFNWASDPTAGVVPGDPAVVERIRGRTLQGMSFELCSRPDLSAALECYLDAVKLLDRLTANPLASATPAYLLPTGSTPRAPTPAADARRELLRYISTALTRATAITAHTSDSQLTLRILRTYHALAPAWTPSFRVRQRHYMLNIYLTALYEAYPPPGATVPEPVLLTGGKASRTGRATWRAEVIEAMRYGQRMLGDTTLFPAAGKYNFAVVRFAELASFFPDRSANLTRDAIALLWWSTSLTFQSQLILRRLTCLLCAGGDPAEARRVFELYVDTVLKQREAENPDSPLTLKRDASDDEDIDVRNPNDGPPVDANGNGETKDPVLAYGEMDTDAEFISTILAGTLLILGEIHDPKTAWTYARLAGDVVRRNPVSRALAAKVDECKGVVRLAMATNVADRVKRPRYQAQAINLLRNATILDPKSANAFYHLAYAEASSRSIEPALTAVRCALELDSESVRSWHLLALLLTASGEWSAAAKACEAGVALWEADDESRAAEEGDAPTVNGHVPATHPLLTPAGHLVPLSPAPAIPPSSFRRLESVIQLRMTLNVITEKLQGPEAALERQQDLFAFFSQRTERSETAERPRSQAMSTRAMSTRTASGRGGTRTPAAGPLDITATADVSVQPPSPTAGGDALYPPQITTTASSSPADLSSQSEGEEQRSIRNFQKRHKAPKHLHVPSVARHMRGGHGSGSKGGGASADVIQRSRTASTSSIALSIAPTMVHSHFAGARSNTVPPPPPPGKAIKRRPPAEERVLSDLWLMSAASFRRAGKLEQSLVAIEEAETRDPENPAVWVQLGLWHQAMTQGGSTPSETHDAVAAFTKSLLLRPDYPPAAVSVARLHMLNGSVDLAHSLLSQLVQDRGWDVPEAWYSLATVCERQDRHSRARECLLYALQLDKTRTCRPLPDALPHWTD